MGRAEPEHAQAVPRRARVGQEISDTDRAAVEQAFEAINGPQNGQVTPRIAAVMALDTYPIGIDATRIQRVADVMYQFGLLKTPFNVSSMLHAVVASTSPSSRPAGYLTAVGSAVLGGRGRDASSASSSR